MVRYGEKHATVWNNLSIRGMGPYVWERIQKQVSSDVSRNANCRTSKIVHQHNSKVETKLGSSKLVSVCHSQQFCRVNTRQCEQYQINAVCTMAHRAFYS